MTQTKINRGFKCFEQDKFGNLYALFIDKNTKMPVGEWLQAEIVPTRGFSVRPGFHVGQIADCPWIKGYNGSDVGCYKGRRKGWKRVFAEVEYIADNDYSEVVQRLPGKCLKNELPSNGYYFFKETGCDRIWIICDKIRIVRVLSEEERQDILKNDGYDEVAAYAKYKNIFEKRIKTA